MALFNFKKNKEKEADAPVKTKVQVQRKVQVIPPSTELRGSPVALLGPRVTEKVSLLSEQNNVYTFNITSAANKQGVAQAIQHLYKVRPVKVSIVKVPSKRVFVRGKRGVKRGGRKAYVFFKKGEKVEIS